MSEKALHKVEADICIHISDQGLIAKMFKELLQTNKKKTDYSVEKWGIALNRLFRKEDVQWPIII